MRQSLAADQEIRTALNHVAGTPAVPVIIAQTVRGQVVDDHGLAAGNRHPGVGTATMRVNPAVGNAQRRPIVDVHVGRPRLGRTYAAVRAPGTFMVGVRRNQGIIAEPGLGLHCMLGNIPQVAIGRCTSWH